MKNKNSINVLFGQRGIETRLPDTMPNHDALRLIILTFFPDVKVSEQEWVGRERKDSPPGTFTCYVNPEPQDIIHLFNSDARSIFPNIFSIYFSRI
jgi:hypothetical protein